MITYTKAVRVVLNHLETIQPVERQKPGMGSKGKGEEFEKPGFRLAADVMDNLRGEAEASRESQARILERAVLWYLELKKG